MPKNNHVFNHFDKTIWNAFDAFLEQADLRLSIQIALQSATSKEAGILAARFPKAWPKFKEIVQAPEFKSWNDLQDDKQVVRDDPNSQEYGRVAKCFIAEVKKIANGQRGNAGRYWAEMMNVGFDGEAAQGFINHNPHMKTQRERLVNEISCFVNGSLNSMVLTWVQYLRLDIAGKK